MRAMRIRSAVLAAAWLCGAAAPIARQQAQAPRLAGPYTSVIAGAVIDAATKKPIPMTLVGLAGASLGPVGRGGSPRQILTDSQGRFVFTGLGPGRYSVLSQRAGYLPTPVAFSRAIELEPDQKATDIVIRMHRLGAISGTVTDENGDPVTGAGVMAFRRAVVNGQAVSMPSSESRTDDRGMYRLGNIAAGDYVICACRRDPVPLDGVLLTTLAGDPAQLIGLASRALKVGADAAAIDGARTFASSFHPSTPLMSRAAHIAVADGEERANVDIQVPVVRAARISGRIVGAPGVSATAIRLRAAGEMPEGAPLMEPMLVQPDGRFDFVGVTPGAYVINVVVPTTPSGGPGPTGTALAFLGNRAMAGPPPPPPAPGAPPLDRIVLWGQALVTVADADVTGVTIAVQRVADVTVKVELPPELTQPPGQAVRFAQLQPFGFDPRGLPALSRNFLNGAFVVPNVAPGRYSLSLSTALPIASVRLGGRDITDLPIEVTESPLSDLVVTLRSFVPTEISGIVSGGADDVCVLLFPADPRLWAEPAAARRWFSAVPVSKTGKFTSDNNLVPGDYLVAVVPDEEAVDWQIKSRLEALAPRAQKVSVAAGEKKVIEVKR